MIHRAIPANERQIEPRLAERFHKTLQQHAPPADLPFTEELAMALVSDALNWKASDLHVEPGAVDTRVRMRVDGLLHDVAVIPTVSGRHIVTYFKVLAQMDTSALARAEHGHARMDAGGMQLDLRITVVPTPNGEMLGIRLLDGLRAVLRLDEIGMSGPEQSHLRNWLAEIQGMLLVCGPVGSGKTSTLYALLRELQRQPCGIVTLEDPVESLMDGITQIEVNEKRGLTFSDAIRAMLRLDPDFLLLGEIRDPESAHTAITAAGSGQALLSTLHARDSVGAVTALRNYGVKNWEISAALEVSVAQRLLRRLCSRCRVETEITSAQRESFTTHGISAPARLWKPAGCDVCAGTGFDGRIGVFEVWRLDTEARTLIVHGADEPALRKHATATGSRTLLADALEKTAAGLTTFAELRRLGRQAQPADSAV
ncbi:GspE/PulE family protein [Prosthecobacter sp.]|uniref:GspE/PulE family protein n=1 Tax=Prosthecobacter sp. TaxID=1965333 RepID=UPI003784CB34